MHEYNKAVHWKM